MAGAMDASSLRHVEHLCEVLYNSTNEQDRQSAQQQLLSLQSSAEYIPQCQYILDNSKSPYALFVASSALTRLITQYWNNFSVSERMDIRNYILSYLAASGPQLPDFVATSLIQLVRSSASLVMETERAVRMISTIQVPMPPNSHGCRVAPVRYIQYLSCFVVSFIRSAASRNWAGLMRRSTGTWLMRSPSSCRRRWTTAS